MATLIFSFFSAFYYITKIIVVTLSNLENLTFYFSRLKLNKTPIFGIYCYKFWQSCFSNDSKFWLELTCNLIFLWYKFHENQFASSWLIRDPDRHSIFYQTKYFPHIILCRGEESKKGKTIDKNNHLNFWKFSTLTRTRATWWLIKIKFSDAF